MIISITAAPTVDRGIYTDFMKREHSCASVADPMKGCCAEQGFQTIYDMPDFLQKRMRTTLLHEHLNFLKGSSNHIILEYSVIEWIADWMRWFWGKTTTEEWDHIIETTRECLCHYDKVFHLEGGVIRPYDGYVWLDAGNSRQIAEIMKYLYRFLDVENKVVFQQQS